MASPWNRHCADCIGTLSFPMLARVLAVAWCPSVRVRLANTSRSSIETAERIGLVIAWSFLPPIFQLCYKEIRVPPKNKGTSLLNFAPNCGL